MDKGKVVQIVLAFMILSFVVDFFWLILFAPAAQDNSASASASPTASPAFTATATTNASVGVLGSRLILACANGVNQSVLDAVPRVVGSSPGVVRVLSGGSVFDVALSENASRQDVAGAVSAFSSLCPGGAAFRQALEIDFPSLVSFNSSTLGLQSGRLPSGLCSQSNWQCLVFASTLENDSIQVAIQLAHNADGTEKGGIQQVIAASSPTSGRPANQSNAPAAEPNSTNSNSSGNSSNA